MSDPGLPERVREHCVAARLFDPPGPVLVAVSGGADSLALLHLLHAAAGPLGLPLTIGHTDHGLHPESRRWADVVVAAGARLGIPVVCRRLDLAADAGETRAREARYAALRGMQHAVGATYLATAHHADDQTETVLFRALRGSGPAGLAGIPVRGPHGLRRPLLPFRRDELRAWLADAHPEVAPVEDPANAAERHDRVWIRRVALPLLRSRFPRVDAALGQVARQAAAERRAWEVLLRSGPQFGVTRQEGGIEVERAPFTEYDNVLSVALLRALCRVAGCRVGGGRVGALLRFVRDAPSGRALDLGGGWKAETVFGRVRVVPPSRGAGADTADAAVAWGGTADAGEARWGAWGITWRREPAGRIDRAAWCTWVLGEGGELRGVRPGDAVRPVGGVGRRRVRRLLMEARVPRGDRADYPVVVCGERIVWVPGVCRGEVALPRPGEPAVRIDVRRVGGS